MENRRNQNKQLLNQIYKNNYFHEMNPNSKKYPHSFQIFSPKSRGKTPMYTRVKNLLNIETNNNINTNKPKEDYEIYSVSNNSSNNNILNNMINKNMNSNNSYNNVNNTVNYTMRGSNYSNYSGSGFTTMTQLENYNAKNNYYRVLFHQVKGHNLALLNQIKKVFMQIISSKKKKKKVIV